MTIILSMNKYVDGDKFHHVGGILVNFCSVLNSFMMIHYANKFHYVTDPSTPEIVSSVSTVPVFIQDIW